MVRGAEGVGKGPEAEPQGAPLCNGRRKKEKLGKEAEDLRGGKKQKGVARGSEGS